MPFPDVPRVIYRKNPLDQVICQLRFPPILKIDAEVPAEFQDRIRSSFPNYSEATDFMKLEVSSESGGPVPPEVLSQIFRTSGGKNYEFLSEDRLWKINLTRTFIALSTNQYERWELFKERLATPLDALMKLYAPAFFSRIGLRYIDVIRRSILGLEDLDWSELLKPPVLGVRASDVGNYVQNLENKYEIGLSDKKSIVRMVSKFVEASDNGEVCFAIDSDFFINDKFSVDDAWEKLDYLNLRGSRLFQWSITDRLHHAMEPETI